MLEILAIWTLCSMVGKLAREKGRKPLGYQFLAAVFWIGGEMVGLIVGVIIMALTQSTVSDDQVLVFYLFGLGGAAVGAIAVHFMVKSLPQAEPAKTQHTRAHLA